MSYKWLNKTSMFLLFSMAAGFANAQNLEVITVWDPTITNTIESYQSTDYIRWKAIEPSGWASSEALDLISNYDSKVAILPMKPEVMGFMADRQRGFEIVGIISSASAGVAASSLFENDYYDLRHYEEEKPYLVVSPRMLSSQYPSQLRSLEDSLLDRQFNFSNTDSGEWGKPYKYTPLPKIDDREDSIKRLKDFYEKAGCGCGPTSSCTSLSMPQFSNFLQSKKPRCPKNPPQG